MDDKFQTISDRDSRLKFKTLSKFLRAQKNGDVVRDDGTPWLDDQMSSTTNEAKEKAIFTPGIPDFSKEPDELAAYRQMLKDREEAAERAKQAELLRQKEIEEAKRKAEEEEQRRKQEIARQIREAEEAARKKAEEEQRRLE